MQLPVFENVKTVLLCNPVRHALLYFLAQYMYLDVRSTCILDELKVCLYRYSSGVQEVVAHCVNDIEPGFTPEIDFVVAHSEHSWCAGGIRAVIQQVAPEIYCSDLAIFH